MHKLKKILSILLVSLVLVTCLLPVGVYAEEENDETNYRIDSYVTQDLIEDDSYFGENNTLKWLNDLFYKMQLTRTQYESLNDVETYIQENFKLLNPYNVNSETVLTSIVRKPIHKQVEAFDNELYVNPYDVQYTTKNIEIPSLKLDLTTVNDALKDDQLVMLVTHRGDEINFYTLHSNVENNEDILRVSSVGVFNLYKQKVHLNQLISNCDSFAFYGMNIPAYKTYPLPNWSSRYYSSPFGMRIHPISGEYTMHNGVDIPAAMGTDVYAVQDGVVTVADAVDDSSAGCWVEIQHDDGTASRYLHASKIYVVVGQRVKAGDVIMAVGSTGASTGPHLHFCYLINNELVDPAEYLASIIN